MYKKPNVFDPSKLLRVRNWTGKVWEHSYLAEKSYLTERGDNRISNGRVNLVMQPNEERSFPEGVAHYLATRMAEWSYGSTTANIAIAADRDERILKALPDLSEAPVAPVEDEKVMEPTEAVEESTEAPKKRRGRPKKVEDEFAGLKEDK